MSIENETLFDNIGDEVAEIVMDDKSGHAMEHAWRVFRVGMTLAEQHDCDNLVVGAAALLHDIHRTMNGEEFVHPRESIPIADQILESVEFPVQRRSAVRHCIEVHEEYGFEEEPSAAETIEAEIIQDADNLDAMGAIGIARTFRFSGSMGTPMWDEGSKPRHEYDKTDFTQSVIEHFDEKLLKLKDDLNTDVAAELARERHEFMVLFLDRFKQEWRGDA